MIEKQINSAGTITLPKEIRDLFGISGICTLYVGIEKGANGEDRIVLCRRNNLDSIVDSCRDLCTTLAIVSSCSVAMVYKNSVIAISNSERAKSFVDNSIGISSVVEKMLSNKDFYGSLLVKNVQLFNNSKCFVRAFFDYKTSSGDTLFFVFFRNSSLEYLNSELEREKVCLNFGKVRDILNKFKV